ncbi:uncharacterized protein LOC143038003 isoform X2 [Oratosquilla oratoria]|uniref:uncharacterized protein LOC143038003 isoform X2 n=1 Tax=Oratosquilla oratoria TaxID=337810 RepID=UPI003F75B470
MASKQDRPCQHIEHHFSQDGSSDVTIRLLHKGQEHHFKYMINHMELEEVFQMLNVAAQTASSELEEKCIQMIKGREDDLIKSQDICSLSSWALESLLKRKDFEVSSEIRLFQAVIKWGKAKVQTDSYYSSVMLRGLINRFLWSIRFLTLTLNEFMDHVETEGIFTPYECMGIIKAIRGARVPRKIPCSYIRETRNGTHNLLYIPLKSHQEADQGVVDPDSEGEEIASFVSDHDILICKIVSGYRGSLIIRRDDEIVSVVYSSIGSHQYRESHIKAGDRYRLLLVTTGILLFPKVEENVKECYGITFKGYCRLFSGVDIYFKKYIVP